MKILFTPMAVAFFATLCACSNKPIDPFTSDGCSAFPEGTFAHKQLWLQCCTHHDLAYWQGGNRSQRLEADLELRECVAQVGQQHIADLMLAGVRVGGTPYFPTNFRWGYGWPYPRLYQVLSEAEIQQIEAQLKTYKDLNTTH